jgi:hypothetical protein
MTAGDNVVPGCIKRVACQRCGATVPFFEFDLENDVELMGLLSAGKCNELKVVVAEISLDERNAVEAGEIAGLPPRLNSPERDGFRIVRVKNTRQDLPSSDLPFSEYRKLYSPPVVVYSCPCCGLGDALVETEMSLSEFELHGGEVLILGDLALQ